MDNLTHSLVGAAIAEAAFQRLKRNEPQTRRVPLYAAAIVASNFPDLDLLLRFQDPTPLGYLLSHRGWTHTFAFCIPQALIILGGLWALRRRWTTEMWFALVRVTILGLLLHIGADFLNSYGVHPLAPFLNDWFYGDSIFIVEPWFWAVMIPPVLLALPWRRAWFLLLIPAFVVLSMGLKMGVLGPGLAALILISATAFYFLLRRLREVHRPRLVLTAMTLVVSVFAALSLRTQVQLHEAYARSDRRPITFVLSPFPGNPLCWTFFSIELGANLYHVSAGTFAHGGVSCPSVEKFMDGPLSPVTSSSFRADERIHEFGQYEIAANQLREEIRTNCQVASLFRFVRVPYRRGDEYGDLRYARRGRSGFSTLHVRREDADVCPNVDAPWTPPRADVLSDR